MRYAVIHAEDEYDIVVDARSPQEALTAYLRDHEDEDPKALFFVLPLSAAFRHRRLRDA